jgi:hypothetical protein
MKVLQRYRRLAGCATVILGLTSLAAPAAAPAQARVAATPVVSRVVASWGDNTVGQLAGATQVAAGTLSSYAVHTVLVLSGQSS